jgi:hyperosmotically inducible protein
MLLSAAGMMVAVACGQSDPGITTAVKAKLAQDDTVKAYQIDVDTANRVVTLSGTVDTAAAKEQAVVLARQTEGVRDIVDQITVSAEVAPTTGSLPDEARDLGREAREEARDASEATKETAKDAAAATGRAVDRAQGTAGDAAITAAVKSKFLADSSVSGLKIDVDTHNGVVTLTGTVASRAEADRAMMLARQTDGVTRVMNNLHVGATH